MTAVIIIIIMALIFLMISIFLFCGKGSFLIAGYNTASEEEKKQFDKKRLCKAGGAVLLVVSIMLFIMAFLGYRVEAGLMEEKSMGTFGFVFCVVILATVILSSVYINKFAKK